MRSVEVSYLLRSLDTGRKELEHTCHGDIAKNALTNPSRPRDAIPLRKCSAHVASSSSKWNSENPPDGIEVIVSYGSRYRLIIGSAMNPSIKIVVSMMATVRKICRKVLLSQRLHLILSSRYLNLQVGHSQ